MVMLPANKSQRSIPSLLVNLGGLGGSDAGFVGAIGSNLQQVVGLRIDIIGFDPRGVGASTPVADCFAFPPIPGDPQLDDDKAAGSFHRLTWLLFGASMGIQVWVF